MPLKLIGLAALAAAGLLAGNIYARMGKRELSELTALIRALSYMETQIAALRTPLPELIRRLSLWEDGLFRETQAALAQGKPLADALGCLYARFADKQVRDLLAGLFSALAVCEEGQAEAALRCAQAELAGLLDKKSQKLRDKAPLARRLALAAALTLAILLL